MQLIVQASGSRKFFALTTCTGKKFELVKAIDVSSPALQAHVRVCVILGPDICCPLLPCNTHTIPLCAKCRELDVKHTSSSHSPAPAHVPRNAWLANSQQLLSLFFDTAQLSCFCLASPRLPNTTLPRRGNGLLGSELKFDTKFGKFVEAHYTTILLS